jgi:hypothetical protein
MHHLRTGDGGKTPGRIKIRIALHLNGTNKFFTEPYILRIVRNHFLPMLLIIPFTAALAAADSLPVFI